MKIRNTFLFIFGLATVSTGNILAEPLKLPAEWTQSIEPFRIAGSIYYVGTRGLGSYLIVSGSKAILIDTGLTENAALIEQNILKLGLNLSDVKIILVSHAHWDHVGALAQIQKNTGAKVFAMDKEVTALTTGKPKGDNILQSFSYTPVKVDHILRDKEVIKMGKIHLKATLTPGHTPGCTTWSTSLKEHGKTLNVVFPCSLSVAGNVLSNNQTYPGIVQDYQLSFRRLSKMPADIVLTSHPEAADLMNRKAKSEAGQLDAFTDRKLLEKIIKDAEFSFNQSLDNQKK